MSFSQLYSKKVMDHFRKPRNMGEIKNPDGAATVGNPVCIPPGSLVMANGIPVKIQNVKKKDRVLGHDGQYHSVKKTYARKYQGPLYSIRVHNLGKIEVTPEHHILALKMAQFTHKYEVFRRGEMVPDWYHASQLEKGDVILYPILKETKDKRIIKLDIPKPRWDFKSKDLPQKIKVNEIFLRLIGYYLAEGYTRVDRCKGTVGFVFGAQEADYINDLIKLMQKTFGLEVSNINARNNSMHLVYYSARLARFFTKLFGKGVLEKRMPHWMITLPAKKQKALLCGLWRGDGYISEKKKTSKFVTISPQLAYQVRLLLLRQKMISSFLVTPERGMHKKHYSIYIREDDSLRKLAGIVGLKVNFPAKKKSPHKSWFGDNFYYVPIWKVRLENYRGLIYNLEVKDTASYVLSAATLHNCGDVMRLFIKVEKKKGKEYIEDIKFQTLGCGAAIATSSMITTMAKGRPLGEAKKITEKVLAEALGGLPKAKFHCSVLAADALRKAIAAYRLKKSS